MYNYKLPGSHMVDDMGSLTVRVWARGNNGRWCTKEYNNEHKWFATITQKERKPGCSCLGPFLVLCAHNSIVMILFRSFAMRRIIAKFNLKTKIAICL